MRSALIIATVILSCCGCTSLAPPHYDSDTPANSNASYDYRGDLTRDGGSDCFYSCL